MLNKKVYLTIDDGPSVDRRIKVDLLHEKGIQAIWFCSGNELEKRPEEALYTILKGGIIGNHAYSHPHFSELSLEECYLEIEKTDQIITNLYQELSLARPLRVFRFPYGDRGEDHHYFTRKYSEAGLDKINKLQHFLKELGYTKPPSENIKYQIFHEWDLADAYDWYWTYDVMEWSVFQKEPLFGIKKLDDIFELMELDLPEKWGGLNYPDSDDIIVIHDHPQTTTLFKPIIEKLLQKGLNFAAIPSV